MKIRIIILVFQFYLHPFLSFSQEISPYMYGINAWMPYSVGTYNLNGKLDQLWGKVKDCRLKLIRIGGIKPDQYQPTNSQYLSLIDSIRKIGAEPIVQVPYNNGVYSATNAASIVRYINITCGRNVKYWSIGNEPDGQYFFTTAAPIASYSKSFASAMKAIDPTIKIVGPDLSWLRSSIYSSLIGGADDITGKDTNGNYYLDIVSFHFYPNSGSQVRLDVTSNNPADFSSKITSLVGWVKEANTLHNRTGSNALEWAVTEFNINYNNPVINDVMGLGVKGFINGQFWAECLGICMKNNAFTFMPWSIHESSGRGSIYDLGFLDGTLGQNPRSSYYHLQLMATYNKTNYAIATDNKSLVKVVATKDTTGTTVMICNQELTSSFSYTVRLDNNTVTGSNSLKINVDNSLAVQFSASIPSQTTQVVIFDSNGILQKIIEYSINDAINQTPPRTIYTETVTQTQSLVLTKDINIQKQTDNIEFDFSELKFQTDFHFTITNLSGQQIFAKQLNKNKESFSLHQSCFKSGVYIAIVQSPNLKVKKKFLIQQ